MLSVTYKPFMLSIFMLNVVILSVVYKLSVASMTIIKSYIISLGHEGLLPSNFILCQ
jgi:hypothetical protein